MKQILAAILLMSTSAFAFNEQIHVYQNSKSDNEILFIYPEHDTAYIAEGIYQRDAKTKHWQATCVLKDSSTLICHYIHKSGNNGTGEVIFKENPDKSITADVIGRDNYESNPNYTLIIPKS